MRLREIMSAKVITVQAKQSANVAWSKMQRHRIRHLVVMDEEQLAGLLSERDLGGRSGAQLRRGRTVEELMTPNVVSAKPNATLRQAANLMRSLKIGSVPVLEDGELVGIVTATDVLDELGRGSSRPEVRAQRRTLRLHAGAHQRGGRPIHRQRSRGPSKTGRARRRKPESAARAPFAGRIPRPAKRTAGRTEAAEVPTHIRVAGAELGPDDRAYVRRKLGMKLGKFATSIEGVSVRVTDVNGPRGGVDQSCRIKVVLSGLPSIVVEKADASLDVAIDGALAAVERAVRRAIQRRRSKPTDVLSTA
jgi:CBS domain-containing protein/ribosome-associated translation inhibitor RaiA